MVKRCCIASCNNSNKNKAGKNKSYHKFPYYNELLRKFWIQFFRDDPHDPEKIDVSWDSSFVCSDHFSPHLYKTYTAIKRLECDAIPSIYMISGKPHLWPGHSAAVAILKATLNEICSTSAVTSSSDSTSQMDHMSNVDGVIIINQESPTNPSVSHEDIAEKVKMKMQQEHSYYNSKVVHENSGSSSQQHNSTEQTKKKMVQKQSYYNSIGENGSNIPEYTDAMDGIEKGTSQESSNSKSDENNVNISQDIAEKIKKKMQSEHSYYNSKVANESVPNVPKDIKEILKKKMRQETSCSNTVSVNNASISDDMENIEKNIQENSNSNSDVNERNTNISQDIAEKIKKKMQREHSYYNSKVLNESIPPSKGTSECVKKKMRQENSHSNSVNNASIPDSTEIFEKTLNLENSSSNTVPIISESQVKRKVHQESSCDVTIIEFNPSDAPESEKVKKKMRLEHSYSNSKIVNESVPQSKECTKKKITQESSCPTQDVTFIELEPESQEITEKVKKKMIQEHSYSISNREKTQRLANKKLKVKKPMKLLNISVKPKENVVAPGKYVLKLRNILDMFKQNQKVEVLEKQVQLLQTSVEKLTRNVQNINDVLKEIKKTEALSENGHKLIEKIISDAPAE